MADVALVAVDKVFADGRHALRRVDLAVGDGEVLAVVGPSGSGKSVLLRVIAGVEPVTGGRVLIGGLDVTDMPAARRNVALATETDTSYPHLSVFENLAFGLRHHGVPDAEVERLVRRAAAHLDLTARLDDRPGQLSGAHRQLMVLGRALVRDPRVLLLDTPLSHVDPALRPELRAEIMRVHRRLGVTTVIVTEHDEEAMAMADRLAVMSDGTIRQAARPGEVWSKPADVVVATAVGTPPMNLAPAIVETVGPVTALRVGPGVIVTDTTEALRSRDGSLVIVGVRAGELGLAPPSSGVDPTGGSAGDGLGAVVETVELLGPVVHVGCALDAPPVHVEASDGGVRVMVSRGASARATWTVAVPPFLPVRLAETVTLHAEPGAVHVFDAATGIAIEP